jgi:membrane protease YdiL (CAAX protease family)
LPRRFSESALAGIFYAIALGLALILAAFFAGSLGETTALVTMLTPAAALLVMLRLEDGTWRSREWWAALGVARAGLGGWPLAILGPIAILVASDAIIVAGGLGRIAAPEVSRPLVQTLANLGLSLAIGLVFAFSEEVGWRGYMLPRLTTLGLVPAMLVVGFAHGVWHLPLMLLTPYYHSSGTPWIVVPLFLVTLTLAGIFYGYLRISTASVWPVAIAHAVFNFTWSLGSEFVVPGSPDTMEYIGGESGVLVIAGLLVAVIVLVPRLRRLRIDEPSVLS